MRLSDFAPTRCAAAQARRPQRGAFLVTTALSLLFLLGFMGLAVDFGRLFVVKSELQTAVDSCALAASRELNGQADAVVRARQAGLYAGNLNRVHFQSQGAGLVAEDIQFSERLVGPFTANPVGRVSHVRCQRRLTGLAPLLLQAFDAFAATTTFGQPQAVAASAVATLMPSQTSCILPVGVCQKVGGYTRGDWIPGVTNSNEDMDASGQFRWLDFGAQGGGGAEIKDILLGLGQCGLPGRDTQVAKSGKTNGAVDAWNTRFGLYASGYTAASTPPDTTGYAWYTRDATAPPNLRGRFDASNGYAYHQRLNSPYQGDNQADDPGLNALAGRKGASSTAVHATGVINSRVVTVAVINCDGLPIQVKDLACLFILHPMAKAANGKTSKMWLEYIGDAAATTNNPCVSAGLAGTGNGQRVPALVY